MRVHVLALGLALFAACKSDKKSAKAPPAPAPLPLEQAQEVYVTDVMAFTKLSRDEVTALINKGPEPMKLEWEAWEKEQPMTPERMTAFYKQTKNYIYDLGWYHFWVPSKYESDVQLVADMKASGAKNILDFGGGVGLNSLMLAQAGLDVTLADLKSTSLDFAVFRAKRHNAPMKIWETDVQAMPPDAKYDVILALDVLEHLPSDVLRTTVDKLIKLKHKDTKIIIAAPFGRTAMHPMHLDEDENTRAQVARLQNELPPS